MPGGYGNKGASEEQSGMWLEGSEVLSASICLYFWLGVGKGLGRGPYSEKVCIFHFQRTN